MPIEIDISAWKEIRWYQLAVRFVIGGLITASTGIIAKKFGPAIGGLFLAFPAIFPASATLIEQHERQRKQEAGMQGETRARKAVGVDAAGAALGSIGLLAFAAFAQSFLPRYRPSLVMVGATFCWMLISMLLWLIRKKV